MRQHQLIGLVMARVDRGASVRIPPETVESNYTTGYLEDRRPASNANPYDITKVIIDTIAA